MRLDTCNSLLQSDFQQSVRKTEMNGVHKATVNYKCSQNINGSECVLQNFDKTCSHVNTINKNDYYILFHFMTKSCLQKKKDKKHNMDFVSANSK